MVIFVVTTIRSRLITQRYSAFYSDSKAQATKKAAEVINGYATVRTFGKDNEELELYSHCVGNTEAVGQQRGALEGLFEGIEFFLNTGVIVLGLWYGCDAIIKETITEDELSAFIFVGIGTIRAFMNVFWVAPEFYKASGSAARIFEVINRKPRIDMDKGIEIPDDEFKGHIEFKNVTFSYANSSSKQNILTNYSLDIPAGTSIALVGSSGSGKSTILSLVLRFYDIQDGNGEILIDGYDLRVIKPRWLLGQLGVVSQMPVLFEGSIEQNVKYSCDAEEYVMEDGLLKQVFFAQTMSYLLFTHVHSLRILGCNRNG